MRQYRLPQPSPVVYVVGLVQERGRPRRHVKIGVTKLIPSFRLAGLQNGCPFELEILKTLPGKRQHEAIVHAALGEYRVRGEWFLLPQDTLQALLETLEGIKLKETA